MPTPSGPPVHDLLERAVAAGILTREQAAAVAALDTPATPPPTTGTAAESTPESTARPAAVLAEVLGYVGGALAVVAALFLGAELWDELGPVPRVLLLAVVTAVCLGAGTLLGGHGGPGGRLGAFLWVAAVAAAAGTTGVAVDGLLHAEPNTSALAASSSALAVAALLWWSRPAVLQHIATHAAAVATLFAVIYRLDDERFDLGGPLLWGLGLAWLAASALPPARDDREGGVWRPAAPGWVLGALAIVAGPLFASDAREAWLVVGAAGAAALVVAGVRTQRPWIAAVGTAGVFLTVPVAVAEIFDARLGPLVAILTAGLALVAAAVVLTRRRR